MSSLALGSCTNFRDCYTRLGFLPSRIGTPATVSGLNLSCILEMLASKSFIELLQSERAEPSVKDAVKVLNGKGTTQWVRLIPRRVVTMFQNSICLLNTCSRCRRFSKGLPRCVRNQQGQNAADAPNPAGFGSQLLGLLLWDPEFTWESLPTRQTGPFVLDAY